MKDSAAAARNVALSALAYCLLLTGFYAVRPELDVNLAGDSRAIVRGFYGVERNATLSWAWTRPQASLTLRTLDRRVPWRWEGRVLFNRAPRTTVRLLIDGTLASEQPITQRHQPLELVIPARPGTTGVTLTFVSFPGFVTAGDSRELGVAFEQMSLTPTTGRPWPPVETLAAGALAIVAVAVGLIGMGSGTGRAFAAWLLLASAGQAWWLSTGAMAYGAYPTHTVGMALGLWLGTLAFLWSVDRLPAAWRVAATYLQSRHPTIALLVGAADERPDIGGWRARPQVGRAVRWLTRSAVVGAYTLPALLLLHSLAFWGRGVIDREAMAFVLNYLADRPLLATIFDPNQNDWGAYQARELSYLVDFIDARIFAALLDRGLLLFIPLSGVAGLVAVAVVYLRGATKTLRLDPVTASLLVSLFLSCIVTQASTAILYRSSKIALSVALLAMLFAVTTAVRRSGQREGARWRTMAGVFVLGLVMSGCDRQGFFLLAALTLMVAVLWLTARARGLVEGHHLAVVITSSLALGVATLYNHVLAPAIIRWANGYSPSFDYQQLPTSGLSWTLVAGAWGVFTTQARHFFGNVPFWVIGTLAVTGWIATVWRSRAEGRSRSTIWTLLTDDVLVVVVMMSGMFVALFALMILRHPAVATIADHAYWYYWTPMHVALLFGISLWLASAGGPGRLQGKVVLYSVVLLMIAGNVARYDQQRAVMITSARWFKGQYERSQRLVHAFDAMQHGEAYRQEGEDVSPRPDAAGSKARHAALEQRFLERMQTAASER